MMDEKLKKRIFLSAVITIFMQTIFVLYVLNIIKEIDWMFISGGLLLIWGILSIFILFSIRKTHFDREKYLFWSLLVNPCLLQFFLSIVFLTKGYTRMEVYYFTSGIAMTLCIPIGITLLILSWAKERAVNK